MVAKTNVLRWPSDVELPVVDARLPPRLDHVRLRLQAGLIVQDAAMLLLGGALANLIWFGTLTDPHNRGALLGFVSLYVLIGLNGGAFAAEILSSVRGGLLRTIRTILLAAAGVILAAFFLKQGEHISRVAFLVGGVLGGVLVATARSLLHGWTKKRYGTQLHSEVLILDGYDHPVPDGTFVLDAQEIGLRCDLRDPMMLDRIGKLLEPADRVVIACPPERRRAWAMVLKGANIRGEVLGGDLTELGPLGIDSLAGGSTIIISTGSFDLRQRAVKRVLDLVLGVSALILLAPLLLIVALIVKLDSPGPVLFIQDRVGRGNRLFGVYKFRSMRAEVCDPKATRLTTKGDSRVTRVGRFIRATSIDELPQLLNIIKGDMSFVGPRPHALGALAGDLLYWEVDERYWHRHSCKPGLTGLAQVRGFRGNTHREIDLTNRLQADLEYMSGWTIWRDVSILLATARVVIHNNAY
jgi:lipopolysaccharide/colanic/teichoic acid biosynthesis glycosyltransferase